MTLLVRALGLKLTMKYLSLTKHLFVLLKDGNNIVLLQKYTGIF